MKYIVARMHSKDLEQMFLFPSMWNHSDFAEVLRARFPEMSIVSAGNAADYTLDDKEGIKFDQIRMFGDSYTLGVMSRNEKDLELFRRLTDRV